MVINQNRRKLVNHPPSETAKKIRIKEWQWEFLGNEEKNQSISIAYFASSLFFLFECGVQLTNTFTRTGKSVVDLCIPLRSILHKTTPLLPSGDVKRYAS
ncbi:MAG: hypothetical protein FE835_05610 [Gammaproteobacteria bacterium]|nr:hypothetical protein [Gammaproteobacteria bacterium]